MSYTQATVLYADIVNFSRQCVHRDLKDISVWMTRIHTTIDYLLIKYAICKVETRGDCCVCVSGTNFMSGPDSVSRDLAYNQATRMIHFGTELAWALYEMDRTEVRIGMATGSIVLTHISHVSDALPARFIYGETVDFASRMEQTGSAGAIQLSECANKQYAEEQHIPSAPLQVKEIPGKGVVQSAMYDCFTGRFLVPGCDFDASSVSDLSRISSESEKD